MTRVCSLRLVAWIGVAMVAVLTVRPASGEPATASEPKATADVKQEEAKAAVDSKTTADSTKGAEKKRSYHQLPPYYGSVIDEAQRAKLYAIQDEYGPQIAELKAKLETLTSQRNEKMAAVLTDDQRAAVEVKKAEAKAKREAKAAARREAQAASSATLEKIDLTKDAKQ